MSVLFRSPIDCESDNNGKQAPVGFVTSVPPRDSKAPAIGFCNLAWLIDCNAQVEGKTPNFLEVPAYARNPNGTKTIHVSVYVLNESHGT